MTIIFRSPTFHTTWSALWRSKRKWAGTDFSEIYPYNGWDVRDIIWRKSTGPTIYSKNREDSLGLSIYSIFLEESGDNFFIKTSEESRSFYKERIAIEINHSAHHMWYRYFYEKSADQDAIFKKIFQKEIKNSLLLVICSLDTLISLPESLRKLAKMNDVILIVTLHPYELSPYWMPNLEWLFLTEKHHDRYKKSIDLFLKSKKDDLQKDNIDMLSLSTEDDIQWCLNSFFKSRKFYERNYYSFSRDTA